MTRKLSISLPDDVAEHLDAVENASAYIAEAIVLRRRAERVDAMLERHGIDVTPVGVAAMRRRVAAKQARRQQRNSAEPA